jgi:hypothetical protein
LIADHRPHFLHHCLQGLAAMAEKLALNQLGAHFEPVKGFAIRFIQHIDPEAQQVISMFFISNSCSFFLFAR